MRRVKTKKLSDVIAEQLEGMILDGTFLSGQKLPPERELAERFEVSRPSIREAIQKLEARDLLDRKQGGGTFVKGRISSIVNDPLIEMISSRPETQFDLLEFRHGLEGMAAYYATLRAGPEELEKLKITYEKVQQTQAADKESDPDFALHAEALVNFYLSMAEATHNAVLLHVIRGLAPILQENIQCNLQALSVKPDAVEEINRRRHQIVIAITESDAVSAKTASDELIEFIEKTLLDINRQDTRMQRALRRIEVK
ncbi:GntR family transcriptional regulator [Alteromonadaceae bacterium M269]|nr:GntR family transcriptional regulator [Alteromonadaceae bacterium M269]